MSNWISLDSAELGKQYVIREVKEVSWKNKMLELGLIPNQKIELVLVAPFGDPIAIELDGVVISLRKTEAKYILVEDFRKS